MKANKRIILKKIPIENQTKGLMIIFEGDTQIATRFAFADIIKGQQEYEFPKDSREIEGVYQKI